MCSLCGNTIKNIFYGREHIKHKHPKEFGVTKDFLDILINKEKTVTKISNNAQVDNGTNEE